MMFHNQADQLKFIAIKSRRYLRMLYDAYSKYQSQTQKIICTTLVILGIHYISEGNITDHIFMCYLLLKIMTGNTNNTKSLS